MTKTVFDGQREGEKVEFVFRRHFLTARKGMLWLVVMTLLGLVPMILWKNDSRMFGVFLCAVLVGLAGFFYAFILWYFSVFIITNQRVRQVSQKGFFKKNVVDLGLDKIQSISYGVSGIVGGIFGYGTILIQTGVGDLVISKVPKPAKVYNRLQNLIQ